jgi:hypothetical protein
MNTRMRKFLYLLILECDLTRKLVVDLWEKTPGISVRSKFSLYTRDHYQKRKEDNPGLSRKEIMGVLREEWRNIPDNEKIRYVVVQNKKPRKPTPYNQFFREMYPAIKSLHPEWNMIMISKELAQRWKETTPEQRQKYEMPEVGIETAVMREDNSGVLSYFETGVLPPGESVCSIREKDPFLTPEQKEQIEGMCRMLRDREKPKLRQMYEHNYNEILPEELSKEELLERIYSMERHQLLLQKTITEKDATDDPAEPPMLPSH